jgi:hypothetical protein
MKAYITNNLIHKINHFKEEAEMNALMEAYVKANVYSDNSSVQLNLDWPSVLSLLDLESLFWTIPQWNEQDPLYDFILSTLTTHSQQELLIRLYDQVFVDCLTKIKNLPQIDQTFLLNQIQKKRDFIKLPSVKEFLVTPLNHYEQLLKTDPYNTIHDLTLYLAWDRVCVNLAILFEHPTFKTAEGLATLKECLVESFQHITKQGRTSPGFFRLMEALYAILMREENLQNYSDADWLILCQSAEALRSRESVCDVAYVDQIIMINDPNSKKPMPLVLTLDSPERVQKSLQFAHFGINVLNKEKEPWNYSLSTVEIICFKEENQKINFEKIIHHSSDKN